MLKFKKADARKFIRVRDRNQITLPAEVLEGLPIAVGDFLEVTRTERGLELKPTRLVTVGTPAAEREDKEAEQETPRRDSGAMVNVKDLEDVIAEKLKKERRAEGMASD